MSFSWLLEALYPSRCTNCSRLVPSKDIFCQNCEQDIKPAVSLHLAAGHGFTIKIFAAGTYQDPMKKLVLKKFSHDVLASRQLAHIMMTRTPLSTMPVDIIVPVPLHWTRYAMRGFNQSREMAKVIAPVLGATINSNVKRVRKTEYQSRLERDARQRNVQNAFAISSSLTLENRRLLFQDKHILIVDDLCTTGATLVSIAKTITPYKPASITALVACRAA